MKPSENPRAVAAFVRSIHPAVDVKLTIDEGTMARLRAHMNRVDRDEPGLARADGESELESIQVALGALIDRGLYEGENDAGVVYSYLTGRIEPRPVAARLRVRLRRAARVLRRGW